MRSPGLLHKKVARCMVQVKQSTRLIAYVDGFNLYFGMKQSKYERYMWLNVHALIASLLKADQVLVCVRYFTSRVIGDAGKMARQTSYLEALETVPDVHIYYGKYQRQGRRCSVCKATDYVANEKMTDVNIATELMADAFQDQFDVAMLVSADSDLTSPVRRVRGLFPDKRVIIAFPPARTSRELVGAASASFTIGRQKLATSQLPDLVMRADGHWLSRPATWH